VSHLTTRRTVTDDTGTSIDNRLRSPGDFNLSGRSGGRRATESFVIL